MKKKIMALTAVFAVALVATYNICNNQNKKELADLLLDDVEALANDEMFGGGVVITCGRYEGRCWNIDYVSPILYLHCYFSGYQSHYCCEK